MKRWLIFALIVRLGVTSPVFAVGGGTTGYSEGLKVDANGVVRAFDTAKPITFPNGLRVNAANLGIANEIYISIRTDSPPCVQNVCGSGTELDPYDGGTNVRLNSILSSITGDKHIHLKAGTYTVTSAVGTPSYPTYPFSGHTSAFVIGNGTVVIEGEGQGKTIIQTALPCTIFDAFAGTAGGLDLTIKNMTLKYTGGYYRGSNAVAIVLASSHTANYKVERVEFVDWISGVLTGSWNNRTGAGEVAFCSFLNTHGRASTAMQSGSGFPGVAVLEAAEIMNVHHNYFNGLTNPSFVGLPGAPPVEEQTAMDGFFSNNASGMVVTVKDNVIINHGVEGIYIPYSPGVNGNTNFTTTISGNYTRGVANAPGGYIPGIRIDRTNGATITNNICDDTSVGIGVSPVDTTQTRRNLVVKNNTLRNVVTGITSSNLLGGIIDGNSIRLITDNTSVLAQSGEAAKHVGIFINVGSDVDQVTNNTITGGTGWYKASATVSSSTHTVVTVNSATGFAAGGMVLLKPNAAGRAARDNGTWRVAIIASVTSTTVTLDGAWADSTGLGDAALNGDTLLFTPSPDLPNSGGIVATNGGKIRSLEGNKVADIDRAYVETTAVAGRMVSNGNNTAAANVQQFGINMKDNGYYSGTLSVQAGLAAGSVTADALVGGNITGNGPGISNVTVDANRVNTTRRTVNNLNATILTGAGDYLVAFIKLTAPRTATLPAANTCDGCVRIIKDETNIALYGGGDAGTYNITISPDIEGETKKIDTAHGIFKVYAADGYWHTLQ